VARNPSDSIFDAASHGETFNLRPQGVFGGAQFGYNWQAAPNLVLGIETDIQASAQTDSTTCVDLCVLPSGGSSGIFTQVTQKLPWFGTLRARLGWTNGPTLYYVTGGWAYGEVKTDYAVGNAPGTDAHSFSHTKSGWTIGGGIETQLVGNWTAKVEYLYIDLGTVNEDFV
jgi:outer membrane immunogenic protein